MKKETDRELKIFMKNIAWLRKKNNLSKKEMAETLGISIATLNKIENGIFPPRTKVELAIAIHCRFGISPSEMVAKLLK